MQLNINKNLSLTSKCKALHFDVSQTSGDPLPTLASELNETVDSFEEMKSVLISISPVPVSFETINGGANGYYSPTAGKIVIDERLPQLQMLKTMVHEIAHATLGHGSKEDKWDRQTKEVQALYSAFQNVNLFKEC